VDGSTQHIIERSPGGRYLRFNERLGSGAYKDVYRAYDTAEGIEVAWNLVKLSGVPAADRARIINEVRLLEDLNHANIISFYGSWVNREKEQVIFVTEILSSGTLKSFIRKVQIIRWKVVKRWALQILRGLKYLHEREPPVIHRDLKCDNIFINGTSGDLRIGDLGLSTVIPNKSEAKTLSVLGTPEFMAPELYDENYNEKIDVYAFGMCLLEIITKENPYIECANPAQVYKKVTNNILPENLDRIPHGDVCGFIKLCISPDPQNRPSASELLLHPILKESMIDDDEVILKDPLDMIVENVRAENMSQSSNTLTTISTKPPSDVDLRDHQHQAISESRVNGFSHHYEDQGSEQRLYKMNITTKDDDISRTQEMLIDIQKQPVNVLIGRQDSTPSPFMENESAQTTVIISQADSMDKMSDIGAVPAHNVPESSRTIQDYAGSKNYRVHAQRKDVDNQNHNITLNITMPVEGKEHNVQFEFDLDNDEPNQVAREMEEDLHVPQGEVSEICKIIEIISETAKKEPTMTDITITPGTYLQPPQISQVVPQPPQRVKLPSPVATPAVFSHSKPFIASTPSVPSPTAAPLVAGGAIQKANLPAINSATNTSGMATSFRNAPSLLHDPNLVPILPSISAPNLGGIQTKHVVPQTTAPAPVSGSTVPVDLLSDPHEDFLFFTSVRPDRASRNIPNSGENPVAASVKAPQFATHRLGTSDQTSHPDDISDCDSDCSGSSEIRKLETEFQKKMSHAKVAFEKRIENLHKSREDKEAQHKMTLEKHQKEIADFEKRLRQAHGERQKRLEQLEVDLKIAKRKRKEEKLKNMTKSI